MWEGLHWTDWVFHWDKDQGALLTHQDLSSEHKLVSPHAVSWYWYPGQEIQIHGTSYYGSSSLITWTGKKASPWVGHGGLVSESRRNKRWSPLRISDFPTCFFVPLMALLWAIWAGSCPSALPPVCIHCSSWSTTLPHSSSTVSWPCKGLPSDLFPYQQGLDSLPSIFWL